MEPYDKITPITPSSQLDINTEFIISIQDRYYKLSKQAFLLVLCLSHGEDMDSAITSYQKKSGSSYSRKQISYVIENAINPIIYNNVIEPKKPLGFIFKSSIFSAQTVRTISKPLSPLFNKYIIVCMLILAVILNTVYLLQPNILHYNGHIGLEGILVIFSITILSSLFHEFGHASACIRYGVSPGDIGVGIYLNFPLFYTDVTKIWCLPQRHRHVVNFAGIYFQCLLLIILDCIYFIIPEETIRFTILSILLSFAITLNPFLKFDGYWIITDILNIPNLREHTYIWLQKKIIGKSFKANYFSPISNLPRWKLSLFILYSVGSILFLITYFTYIIPYVIITSGQAFITESKLLISCLVHSITPPFSIVKNIISYLIFLSTVIFLCWNILKLLIKRLYFS